MDEKNNPDDEKKSEIIKKANNDIDKNNEEINEENNKSSNICIISSYNNETHIMKNEENDKYGNIIKYNIKDIPLRQNNYYIDKNIKPNNICNDIIINNVDVSEYIPKNDTSNVNMNHLSFSINTKKNDNINNNDSCYNYKTSDKYRSSLDRNNKNYCKQNCNILNISKENINEKYDVNKNDYISLVKHEEEEKIKNNVNTQNDYEFLYNMDNIKLTGTSVILTNENSKYIYKLIPFFKNGEAHFYTKVSEAYNDIYKKGKKKKTPLQDIEMDNNKNKNIHNIDDNNNIYYNCNYYNLCEYADMLFTMDYIYNLFLETQKKCIEDNSGKNIFFSLFNKRNNISIVHNKINNPSNVGLDVCNTYEEFNKLSFEEKYYHTILCEPIKKLYTSEKKNINIYNILNENNYNLKTCDCKKKCDELSSCNDKTVAVVKCCQNKIYEKFILSLLVKYKLIPQYFDLVQVAKCIQNEKNKINVKEDINIKMYTNVQPINQIKQKLNNTNNEDNINNINNINNTYNTNHQHNDVFIKLEKNSTTKNNPYEDIHSMNKIDYNKNKCISNNDQEIWKVYNEKCKNNHDINIHSSLKLEKLCHNIKSSNQQIIDLKLGYNTVIDNDLTFNKDLLNDSHSVDWNLKEYYVDKWSQMKKDIRKKFTTTNISDQHIIDLCSKDLNLPTCFDKYNNKDIYALLKSWRQSVTSFKSTQRNLGFRICTLIQHINYSDLLNDDQVKIQYSQFAQNNCLFEKNNILNTQTNTLKKYSELNKIEIKDCYDHVTKKLKINRHLGFSLREDQVIYFLSIFLKKIVHLILPQLLNLKIWLEQQSLYSFCSTSLLIIYDKNKPSFCDIKWIDFTYSLENKSNLKLYPLNNTKLNMDIIYGLNNLIKLCRTIFFSNIIPQTVKNNGKSKREE
ncbi:kinase, putative [Plasmodium sp. gorilla clade G2]|uniref:kinase, putative n=1 Tax=Plasmodium sp. gorilla clade G2 TaxID=880535 RepID=UPI000D20E5CD|nr:kinase, putative [Plasmodium sp. gorilla clade G2]SOV11683.1 kinase, putative [Plasmodium sp. gorilla clade G2]